MKVWGAIFLVCSISCANAKPIEVEEERHGSAMEKSQGGKKGESSSSVVREKVSFTGSSPEEEMEESSAFFLSSDEMASPPGGGAPLDEKILDVIAPLPDLEAPWWENWWEVISGWFSGGKS